MPPTNAADELAASSRPARSLSSTRRTSPTLGPLRLEPLYVVTGRMRGSERGYGVYRVRETG